MYRNIIFLVFLLIGFLPRPVYAQESSEKQISTDTTLDKTSDKIIDEAITASKPLKKDKVEYLSQVTKYGFKNLFKNYTYNASMPYTTQVNPYAENYMEDYLHANTKYLQNLRQTGRPYFNLIDGILTQYGLPRELKYLAVIESNLKPNALSSAGALGPWQFMSYTAKDYGLRVSSQFDDRTDYTKSTNAAAKYLLSLYKDLNDWLLVIAAYNGGPGRVYQAIRKSGSRNFWNLQYYLPEESRNHVKKFIATHYIMESGDDNNPFDYKSLSSPSVIPALSDSESAGIDETLLSGRYRAGIIAKNLDISEGEFNRLNPGFDTQMTAGADYTLRLPKEKMQLFEEKKFTILNDCVELLFSNINIDSKTVYKKRK